MVALVGVCAYNYTGGGLFQPGRKAGGDCSTRDDFWHGQLAWQVPDSEMQNVQIRVSEYYDNAENISAPFSISTAPTSCTKTPVVNTAGVDRRETGVLRLSSGGLRIEVPPSMAGVGVQLFSMQGRLLAYRSLPAGGGYLLNDLVDKPGMYMVVVRHQGLPIASTRWIRHE